MPDETGMHITAATWGRITDLLTDAGYPPLPPAQCATERPFGPCTQRCEQPAGHDGQHRAQCFTWCCDQHVPDACAPDEGAHQADDYPRPCCEQCPNGEAA